MVLRKVAKQDYSECGFTTGEFIKDTEGKKEFIYEEKLKKNTKQQTNTNNTKTSPVGIIKRINKVSSGHTQKSFSEA